MKQDFPGYFQDLLIIPLLQVGNVTLVNILIEHSTDLDIVDGNGSNHQGMSVIFGPEMATAVQ